MSDIRATIRGFILRECLPGESPENLRDDTPLLETGILDSLRTVQLVAEVEREAQIEINARDVDESNFRSVDAIVSFVERRRAGV
jgi:acyl carrier protein